MAQKKDSENDYALLGLGLLALLALAIGAAMKAQNEAKRNNVPYVIEENGILYEIYPDGMRKEIGRVENPRYKVNESTFRF